MALRFVCMLAVIVLAGATSAAGQTAQDAHRREPLVRSGVLERVREVANQLADTRRIPAAVRAAMFLELAELLQERPSIADYTSKEASQSSGRTILRGLNPGDQPAVALANKLIDAALIEIRDVEQVYPELLVSPRKQPYAGERLRATRNWLRVSAAGLLASVDPARAEQILFDAMDEPPPADLGCDSPVVPFDDHAYNWAVQLAVDAPDPALTIKRLSAAMGRSKSLAAAYVFARALIDLPPSQADRSPALRAYAAMLGRLSGTPIHYSSVMPVIVFNFFALHEAYKSRDEDARLLTAAMEGFLRRRSMAGRCPWHTITSVNLREHLAYEDLGKIGLGGYSDPLLPPLTPPTKEDLDAFRKGDDAFRMTPLGKVRAGPPLTAETQPGSEESAIATQKFAESVLQETRGDGEARRLLAMLLLSDWVDSNRSAGTSLKNIDLIIRLLDDPVYWNNDDAWLESALNLFDAIRYADPKLSDALHARLTRSPHEGLRIHASISQIRAATDADIIANERSMPVAPDVSSTEPKEE